MENRDFMYYSKVTGKPYETKEELIKAEDEVLKAHKAAEEQALADQKAKEELKAQRATRAKDIEKAYDDVRQAQNKLNEMVNQFCKDYGSFHMTVREPISINNWFDNLFNNFIF